MSGYTFRPKTFAEYGDGFPNLKMDLDGGILTVTMHDGSGGPMIFAGDPHPHLQLTEAFYEMGRDVDLRAIILTGAGGAWVEGIDFGEDAPPSLPPSAFLGMDTEAIRFVLNQLNIPVPMIAAVDGHAYVQSQMALMCDVVIASETALFADLPHYPQGVIPGDGAHVLWPAFVGPGRARHFLLTGRKVGAAEALDWGFVQEVVPAADLLVRARELARQIAGVPPLTARYSRMLFAHDIRKQIVADLPFGITAEILAMGEFYPTGVRK